MSAATLPDHAVSDALAILLKHLQIPHEEGSNSHSSRPETEGRSNLLVQLRLQDVRMESAMLIFTDVVKYRLATLRRQQNHMSPIYSLPAEILAYIFQKSVEDDFACKGTYVIVSGFAYVSSHFRNVALSTPQLWAHIDARYTKSLVIACISRSRNLPLHLFISEPGPGMEREDAFLRLMVPHMARWETFECESGNFDELRMSYFDKNTPMPLLRTFKISNEVEEPTLFPNSVSHHAPLLQSLDILHFSLPVNAPGFSRLRNIRFWAEGLSSSERWYSFLYSSPELEELHALGNRGYIPETRVTPFQVSLPRLRKVILSNIPSSMIGVLLSAISSEETKLPSISLVQILEPWQHDYNVGIQFQAMFPPSDLGPTLLGSIRRMTSLSAEYRRASLKIKAETELQHNLFSYESKYGGEALHMYRTLISPIVLPNLREIDLNGSQFFADGTFSSNLHLCTSLERLSIRTPDPFRQDDQLPGICERLTTVETSHDSADRPSLVWPCPNLKYLGIFLQITNFSPIINLIQARYGGYETSVLVENRPVRLEELRLSIIEPPIGPSEMSDTDYIARIRDILDPLGTAILITESD